MAHLQMNYLDIIKYHRFATSMYIAPDEQFGNLKVFLVVSNLDIQFAKYVPATINGIPVCAVLDKVRGQEFHERVLLLINQIKSDIFDFNPDLRHKDFNVKVLFSVTRGFLDLNNRRIQIILPSQPNVQKSKLHLSVKDKHGNVYPATIQTV